MRHLIAPLLAATLASACAHAGAAPTASRRSRPTVPPASDTVAHARFLRGYDMQVVPPRPRLGGSSPDTNDARLYFARGLELMPVDPTEAAEAFAWAARLDPLNGQAYYNRWYALDARRVGWAWTLPPRGDRARDAADARLDSLRTTAFVLNPFVATGDDIEMVEQRWGLDDWTAGHREFARGAYDAAIERWGRILRKYPDAAQVRIARARAMYFQGRFADAAQELEVILASVDRAQRDSVAFAFGASTEMLNYAVGFLQAQRGDRQGAREAYEAAIADNLGFYMAHARLAGLALLDHDTTTALVEYATAVAIRGDDPALRMLYGYALFQARHLDDAERQLREATRLDADYAMPYVWLGRVLDARGDAAAAELAYRAFLAHASRADGELAAVRGRLAAGPAAAR